MRLESATIIGMAAPYLPGRTSDPEVAWRLDRCRATPAAEVVERGGGEALVLVDRLGPAQGHHLDRGLPA